MTAEARTERIESLAQAEAVAYEYAVLVEAMRETERRRLLLRERLLDFMERRDLRSIHDGEHGVTVERAPRNGPSWYDTGSMPDELVLRLRDLAVLGVDTKMLRTQAEAGEDVSEAKAYAHPGAEQVALLVRHKGAALYDDPREDEA